ncbi:hypothetical protein JD276_15105 [Leucobacter sp. CSA1]|uniref:LPXTG-motif cell wall-anchored protein n=1 Tax=Leucobacter chromiisoli TaxID=2796471 RepID=A0A934Q9G2_9MICO|nr:thioester domain-containing protein [Leucobacter chromiisoli]MBK0420356.1 hypothetical protein [Leucobacter chromiisoli]
MTAVSNRRRARLHLTGLLLAALFLGSATTALHPAPPSSTAAEHGNFVWFGGWPTGSFRLAGGDFVYCIEPGTSEPSGAQRGPVEVSELPGYTGQQADATGWSAAVTSGPASGEALRHINYVLSTYGNTTDLDTAASVQLAIWMLRGDPGLAAWLDHHLNWVRAHGGELYVVRAAQMTDEARARALPAPDTAPAPLVVTRDAAQSSRGAVSYPAGTTELRISGGVFENGERTLTIGDGRAGTAGWSAELHPDGWKRRHEIEIGGEWSVRVQGWPDRVVMHPAVIPTQQGLASGIGPISETRSGDFDPVRADYDAQFSPVLSTRVDDGFVERDSGRFSDTVTFSVAEGSEPWTSRSAAEGGAEHAPVVAEGVVYGPFTHPPTPAAEPPAGAPVAGRARVVADRGPGEYRVRADARPAESGYYSWVWTIRQQDQSAEIRDADLLPEGYRFSDAFGLGEEGQIVPTALRWSTRLVEDELTPDHLELRDRVTPELRHGAWLRDENGDRIPARLRLTVYQSDAEPERQSAPPESAREVASAFATVAEPGREVDVEPIRLAFETRGWVSVRTCLVEEDQDPAARGRFEEWCDDYGIPEETARIVLPEVRTEAQPTATVGETISDTAIVAGAVPKGATVGFDFYLEAEPGQPKYTEQWRPVRDEDGSVVRWTEEELQALSEEERCLVQPVARTARVDVEGPGRVVSPRIVARSAGTGYWVEDLTMPHPATGEAAELHRGACGLENERTVISEPGSQTPGESGTPGPGKTALAETGDETPVAAWAAASALLLLGAGAVVVGRGRARRRGRRGEEGPDVQSLCSSRKWFS